MSETPSLDLPERKLRRGRLFMFSLAVVFEEAVCRRAAQSLKCRVKVLVSDALAARRFLQHANATDVFRKARETR